MRCVLESHMHHLNSFITLTYDDEHLPQDRSLNLKHLQDFMKRLRKKKWPFHYYACGEYGDLTQRAHYHALLFGLDFQDKTVYSKSKEYTLYYSKELTEIWGQGHTLIGDVTFDTAAYTARYVLKKKLSVDKKRQHSHYLLDEETGELKPIVAPFATMSLSAPIGALWHAQFNSDIYSADKDYLVMRGKKMKPPKAFDKLYDSVNPAQLERIKDNRIKNRKNLTKDELRAHEKIARARIISKKKV